MGVRSRTRFRREHNTPELAGGRVGGGFLLATDIGA